MIENPERDVVLDLVRKHLGPTGQLAAQADAVFAAHLYIEVRVLTAVEQAMRAEGLDSAARRRVLEAAMLGGTEDVAKVHERIAERQRAIAELRSQSGRIVIPDGCDVGYA